MSWYFKQCLAHGKSSIVTCLPSTSLPSSHTTHLSIDNASSFSEHKYPLLPSGLYITCSFCLELSSCSLHGWLILSSDFSSSDRCSLTTLSELATSPIAFSSSLSHFLYRNCQDHKSCLFICLFTYSLSLIRS